MRYSKLTSYRPTFRVPFTPVVQILSIGLFVFFIADLGLSGLAIAGALGAISLGVYLIYGRSRHTGEYALLHLIERITNRAIAGNDLERELRDIVHEKDEIKLDSIDEVFKDAQVLDVPDVNSLEELFAHAAHAITEKISVPAKEVERLLWKRERESSTAISPFVAVPHLVLKDSGVFSLLCVRVSGGVPFTDAFHSVKAIFVLSGSSDQRTLHLQVLAAIAQIAMDPRFEDEWTDALRPEQLREVLLLGKRRRLEQ
jgi:mannitol/fructose-specific phosphotransferase system IIA component (Ntr-type)